MRWFGKGKQSDVWEDAVPEVIKDLEAAQRIRRICEAAADIAEKRWQPHWRVGRERTVRTGR